MLGSTEASSADRRTQCELAQPAIHSASGHQTLKDAEWGLRRICGQQQ